MPDDLPLIIAGISYKSRLILGTGKYKTLELMKQSLEAADPAMVTVAIRRVNLSDKSSQSFWAFLPEGMPILPNTAGCYTAEDAIRTAHLAREALETDLIKLEVIGDPKTLFPDVEATLEATRVLVKEGFTVLPYTSDDPIVARHLEEAGAATIEDHPVQYVDRGPRQISAAYAIHRRRVTGPPGIGKSRPVDVQIFFRAERAPFSNEAAAPVNDGPEDIENERLHGCPRLWQRGGVSGLQRLGIRSVRHRHLVAKCDYTGPFSPMWTM